MFQTYHGQTAKFIATVAQNMPPLTADVMQEWIENPRLLAKALAEALMPPVEHTPTPSQQRAREIMGRNMFGVEEAIKLFNVRPTAKQLAVLAEVPFSEEVLQEYRDTHILVADFGLSIMDVKALHPELFYDKDDACWYNTEPFAEKRGKVCWRLVRKTVVPDSYSKTYLDQMALLDKNEENPEVRVMVYTIIGHFLATEERLFGRVYTRCQDLSSGGRRVVVGGFGSGGLDVSRCWDGRRVVSVGLASARKVRSS